MGKARRFLIQTALLGTIGVAAAGVVSPAVRVVLFGSLPFPEPDRLVLLWETLDRDPGRQVITSIPTIESWGEGLQSVEAIAAARHFQSFFYDRGDGAQRVQGAFVSRGYLELTGATPSAGRLFTADESVLGAPRRSVVVSHRFWMEELGGGEDVVGRVLRIDDQPWEVVGVMDPEYEDWADAFVDNALWFPLPSAELKLGRSLEDRGFRRFRAFGRLAPGVSVEEANVELAGLHTRMADSDPESFARFGARVESATGRLLGSASAVLRAVTMVAALLLGLTILNVSVLTVLQGSVRGPDTAIRRALGASRWGALTPLLKALALSSAISLVAGLALAEGLRSLVFRNAGDVLPLYTRLDFTVFDLGVCAEVAVLMWCAATLVLLLVHGRETAGFFGATREQAATGLGYLSTSRSVFVFLTIAASMSIVVPGLVVQRGFRDIIGVDPGFHTEGYWSSRVDLPPEVEDAGEAGRVLEDLLVAVEEQPGLRDAVLWGPSLPGYTGGGRNFVDAAAPASSVTEATTARYHQASREGLERLGVRLRSGRYLGGDLDPASSGEVVVSQAFAETLWPGEDAIGRSLQHFEIDADAPGPWTVVGIAENALMGGRMNDGGVSGRHDAYFSDRQHQARLQQRHLLVRSDQGGAGIRTAIEAATRSVNPRITAEQPELLEPQLAIEAASLRMAFVILSLLSAWAVVQAAAGILVVVAFIAHSATRALAVQKALGADAPRVVAPLALSVAGMATAATIGGVLASAALGRVWTPPGIEWSLGAPSLWFASFSITAVAITIALLPPLLRIVRLSPLMLMR
ncbi:MAG: ABC transporter permease [Gemmatimonadota bacterium]